MRSLWKFALALLCPVALLAADADSQAELKDMAQKLITESRTTREMATQIAEQLRKTADTAWVREQIPALEQHAASIRQLISDLEPKGTALNARQRQQSKTAREVTGILSVFLENKKRMPASVTSPRDRDQVRHQALGVAQRAEMIEKTISKLGL